MQKKSEWRAKMTPLDILPMEARCIIMMLAGMALAVLISMTAGQMALEIIYCNRQSKTQIGGSE